MEKKGCLHLKWVWTLQVMKLCARLYLDNLKALPINCQGELMKSACAVYQTLAVSATILICTKAYACSLLRAVYNETCLKFKKTHYLNVSECRNQ